MKVELLRADVEELRTKDIQLAAAFERGAAAIGARPTHDKPIERPGTRQGLDELVHLVADASADMHMLQFSFAMSAPTYQRSRQRYELADEVIADLQRQVAPRLRARLRELRLREAELERLVLAQGVDPRSVGPQVPREKAIDPTPKPGEFDDRPRLSPLPPRRSLLERLKARVRPR